jgi:hypothetical protein
LSTVGGGVKCISVSSPAVTCSCGVAIRRVYMDERLFVNIPIDYGNTIRKAPIHLDRGSFLLVGRAFASSNHVMEWVEGLYRLYSKKIC